MSNLSAKTDVATWTARIICVLWALWIIVEYTSYHTYLTNAVFDPQYGKLMGALAITALLIAGYGYRKRIFQSDQGWTIHYRGIYLYLIVLALSMIIISVFSADRSLLSKNIPQRLGHFAFFSSAVLGAVALIFTSAHNLGHLAFKKYKSLFGASHPILCIALGISFITMLMFWLGLFHILHPIAIGAILALSLLIPYKSTWTFIQQILLKKHSIQIHHWWTIPVLFVLLTTISIAWIGSLKAYPTGYDGSSLYMNTTRLMAGDMGLPSGGQAFNWSIFMSLGQLLFNSETISILLSHLMGVLCLFVIYRIARFWLDKDYALLATVLSFASPYYCFHAMIDEKVDLAFLFFALSCFLMVITPWINRRKKQAAFLKDIPWSRFSFLSHAHVIWLLAGWLCGFAFGIKYTAFFLFVALVCMLFYHDGHKKGFISAFLFCLGTLFLFQIYRFSHFDISIRWAIIFGGILVVLGLGSLFYFFKSNLKTLRSPIIKTICFFSAFLLAFIPWSIKNIAEHGQVKARYIIEGESVGPKIEIAPKYLKTGRIGQVRPQARPIQYSPSAGTATFISDQQPSKLTQAGKAKKDGKKLQTRQEELKRYIGYESGIWPYLSLPYDLTMNTNIPNQRYLDFGFLFLLFLPLLLLSGGGRPRSLIKNIGVFVGLMIWLAFSYLTLFFKNIPNFSSATVLNQRSEFFSEHIGGSDSWFYSLHSIFITPILKIGEVLQSTYGIGNQMRGVLAIIGLLLISVGLYFMLRDRIRQLPRTLRLMASFVFVYLFLWSVMGNGIIWYGFPIWVLLPILILYFFNHPELFLESGSRRFTSMFFGVVMTILLVYNTSVFFSNPRGGGKSAALYSWPFIDYISNATSDKYDVLKYYNASYPQALKAMNKDKSKRIYKVNTFLGYHIDQNDTRVLSDSNLGEFDKISKSIATDEIFLDVLKDNNFNYILYDLKTPSIDRTAEQTLVKKSNRLLQILTQSNKVELVVTDNYVDNPSGPAITLANGKKARIKPGLIGNTVKRGSFVLYKIR